VTLANNSSLDREMTWFSACCTRRHSDRQAEWLIYFDPRIGVSMFEMGLTSTFPGIGATISAVILLAIGSRVIRERYPVSPNSVAEGVLGLPSVVFFVLIAIVTVSPSHGFSVGELCVPIIVFAISSGIPLWMALQSRRQ
jgi:hypothetical protein